MAEQFQKKYYESPESIHAKIRLLRKKVYDLAKNGIGVDLYARIARREYDFAMNIQKRHPDFNHYRCYHQLIGSTPPPDVYDGDFDADDSVEKFYKSLLEEIGGKDDQKRS